MRSVRKGGAYERVKQVTKSKSNKKATYEK